jgi:hypothetical protein
MDQCTAGDYCAITAPLPATRRYRRHQRVHWRIWLTLPWRSCSARRPSVFDNRYWNCERGPASLPHHIYHNRYLIFEGPSASDNQCSHGQSVPVLCVHSDRTNEKGRPLRSGPVQCPGGIVRWQARVRRG